MLPNLSHAAPLIWWYNSVSSSPICFEVENGPLTYIWSWKSTSKNKTISNSGCHDKPLKQKPQIQMAIMEIFQKYIGAYFLMPWNLIFTNSTIPLPHGTHPSWRWNVSLLNSLIDENSTIKAITRALLNMINARTDKKSDNTKSKKSLTLIECHTPYQKIT